MSLRELLEGSLGKSIVDICGNHFHDLSQNHCAHYVSHMLNLTFSFNCKEYKGGTKPGANVRVHEVFAQCPRVGLFDEADPNQELLVFVTRENNVDLQNKKMGNIPQKHIGVFSGGHVYHYANTPDRVVKWTAQHFLDTFQNAYAGNQRLFSGTFPGSDLLLNVAPSGEGISGNLPFSLRKDMSATNGSVRWFATALAGDDREEFYVGRETRDEAKQYFGIFQRPSEYYGPRYDPEELVPTIAHWAYLLDATAHCESNGYINLINTYDRAKFTFGFYQLAAHTPLDNLILLFRELLKLEDAPLYFPELRLVGGRVHRAGDDGGLTNLEIPDQNGNLQRFMDFLNPQRKDIDEQEILHAARLMHWTKNDVRCREAQMRVCAEILQHKMATRYAGPYGLDGKSDVLCAIIADIHHNGRASKDVVKKALAKADPQQALLRVNDSKYKTRNRALETKIQEMSGPAGPLGKKVYDAANNEFI